MRYIARFDKSGEEQDLVNHLAGVISVLTGGDGLSMSVPKNRSTKRDLWLSKCGLRTWSEHEFPGGFARDVINRNYIGFLQLLFDN